MNRHGAQSPAAGEVGLSDVIKIAILAVGGQGGGVLSNWIADLATLGGYAVQVTSVAGVAQRTGATIYYVEMAPKSNRLPIFAQSPSPGDVDIMIAAELMEAGRAVMRGFVTPDRTTLIASSHRILAISEKQVPGDGRSDAGLVRTELTRAAYKAVCFDMEKIAADQGSVISSSLFGGLARSGALPFDVALYEAIIRKSGRGVEQSLAAFRAALEFEEGGTTKEDTESAANSDIRGPANLMRRWENLSENLDRLNPACRDMAEAGLRKVVDYQDVDYGEAYLEKILCWQTLDDAGRNFELTRTAAKHIANAMCYDDILRVADLKIRATRNKRLRKNQQLDSDAIVRITEYFHPRAEEICGTMPRSLGAWFENSPRAFKLLDRLLNKGRRIRTDRLHGFMLLKLISLLKPYRRNLHRHGQETRHLDRLTTAAEKAMQDDYRLAVEILTCQRLVKGYSDTHARGHSKFSKVLGAVEHLVGRDDAAEWIRRLREVALRDENGSALDGALKTVRSFTG